MINKKYDSLIGVSAVLFICGVIGGFYGVGYAAGNNNEKVNILKHSCDTACVAMGSKMAGREGNLCVCEDLTTMRGEYRQLFLHGRTLP